jgi:hypothetical protein
MKFINISCILLALINSGFFIYSNIKIKDLKEVEDSSCHDLLNYNFKIVMTFIFSIVIGILNLCCNQLLTTVLYSINGFLVGSIAVTKYYYHNNYCNETCNVNCVNSVNLSQKIDLFFLVNVIFIALSVLVIGGYYIRKLCCKNNQE